MNETSRPARRRRQRGNAMLESALVFATVFPMILITFDAAFALFLIATFNHAVREGARYAITYQTMQGLGQDASIKQKVVSSAFGFVSPDKVRVYYYDPKSATPDVPIPAPGGNEPDNIVVVEVSGYSWAWIVPRGLLPGRAWNALEITASSADRMEAVGGGAAPPTR
jgi:heme/copper-type cytochrome/quinol oxidase subunit 2